jgi:hypothetical protein
LFKRIPTLEEYELDKAKKALSLFNGTSSANIINDLLKHDKKPTVRIKRLVKGGSSSFSSYQIQKERAAKALRLNGAI